MNTEEMDKARDLMSRMKADVRAVIDKYHVEANALANKSADPHSPVVAAMQMALANAAVDYIVSVGVPPVDGLQIITNITGVAMKQWLDTVLKLHKLKAKVRTTTDTVEVQNEKKLIIN